VVVDGSRRKVEARCHLGVGEAVVHEPQHLDLSVGQTDGVPQRRAASAGRNRLDTRYA
jgi:hypothetical protein